MIHPRALSLHFLTSVALLLLNGQSRGDQPTPVEPLPNIVLILADDLGYGDLKCYNHESLVPTPHLDRLAATGMRFTNAYCPVSICTPTRYSLMTGKHSFRGFNRGGVLGNWERPLISADETTLPGLLKRAGYITGGFGKWHLGADYKTLDGKQPAGYGKFQTPDTGANLDLSAPIGSGPTERGFDRWYGFICSSEMLIFDQNRAAALLSHDLYPVPPIPGVDQLPLIAMDQYQPAITSQAVEFIQQHAGKEEPFFVYFAPYVPHIPLAVAKDFRGRTKAGAYGDYVHQLDHNIGELLNALQQGGIEEQTLILFVSDNGSQFLKTGEGHRPNGHLRDKKASLYEGGLRTPLIANWPGKVAAGAVLDDLICSTDFVSTLAALTNQQLPADAAPDSINQLPRLLGQTSDPARHEVLLTGGKREHALRKDNWKLIPIKRELYDLHNDPSEQHNIYADHPQVVQELKHRLQEILGNDDD